MEEQLSGAAAPTLDAPDPKAEWACQLAKTGDPDDLDPAASPDTVALVRDGRLPDDWDTVVSDLVACGSAWLLRIVAQNLQGQLRASRCSTGPCRAARRRAPKRCRCCVTGCATMRAWGLCG